jgi:hypothetical protein
MKTNALYQVSPEDFQRLVEDTAKKEVVIFLSRFHGVLVGVADVANFHNVSKRVVYGYVERGNIVAEHRDKDTEEIKFRLDEVLLMDFKKLKKQEYDRSK